MASTALVSNKAAELMKVAVPLAKNILAPLELTPEVSAICVESQKKIHCPDVSLVIYTVEINDIIKNV